MRIKDRRKQWQKDCINFSWSRCGTIATPRGPKTLEKKQCEFLASGEYQTKFIWYDDISLEDHKHRIRNYGDNYYVPSNYDKRLAHSEGVTRNTRKEAA